MIAICNGSVIAYLLSDEANITNWPLIIDGTYQEINGLEFDPITITGVVLPAGTQPRDCEHVDGIVRIRASVALAFKALKDSLAAEIEAAVMAVYSRPVALAREYELREADALAYKTANYEGAVGRVLAGFATAKNLAAREAADLVLVQAELFRGAELNLADLRMQKYAVERAATEVAARAIYSATMIVIRQIAAGLA